MQNQPWPGRGKQFVVHDRQAARTREDAFKGGAKAKTPKLLGWLRNPWKPAAGRLFPDKEK